MTRTAVALVCWSLASVAIAQTPPAPQTLAPPVRSQPQPTAPQTATPERPNHWFYDMLDKSDPRHLTAKKPPARPPARE